MEGEIYTVDISPSSNLLIYGGSRDTAEIHSVEGDYTVCTLSDFPESVLYTKFLSETHCIVVSIDGTILRTSNGAESTFANVGEELSVAFFREKLVLGAESGHIYLYDANLEHINTFGGHSSQIISVDYQNERIYSLSVNNLLVHDEYGRCIITLKAHDATSFCCIGGDVVCLGREARVQVFKGTRKLFELPSTSSVDTVAMAGPNIVAGGDFEYLVLIDSTVRYATYKLETGLRTLRIQILDVNTVVFSTPCGKLAVLDIRDIKTLCVFESRVGTVFDFAVSPSRILAGGENGVALFDLLGTCLFHTSYVSSAADVLDE